MPCSRRFRVRPRSLFLSTRPQRPPHLPSRRREGPEEAVSSRSARDLRHHAGHAIPHHGHEYVLLSRRRDTDRAPVVSRREGEIRVCIPPRPAGPSRLDADLLVSLLPSQTPTRSARRVARHSLITSPPRRSVFHVGKGRRPPRATRRSGGQIAVADARRSLGTAPKRRPSLTSRASLPRIPGCLRHHPHHSRSALDAEDDSGRLRRYVSSARAIARRPEARSAWALSLRTRRRGKVGARALTFPAATRVDFFSLKRKRRPAKTFPPRPRPTDRPHRPAIRSTHGLRLTR